ncbi:GNAT family N-acetyltransferase [Corallincola platygyrae]|uniref:GNAT family N-acetyltransferase n=1 Tax=Corallincola platygyrae TaxID=1193278 RepID=A0ABW4XNZ6_9GAMM
MSSVVIARIRASHTYPIRSAVLRTGLPIESSVFDGDDAETTRHYGAFLAQADQGSSAQAGQLALVGIVSLYQNGSDALAGSHWQLRAMATLPKVRGLGIGQALVKHLISASDHPEQVWCNARSHAAGFYQKLGFVTQGAPFEIPGVGPHVQMRFVADRSNFT